MSKTMDALKEAFAGESQANRKYLAFAEKADKDGHPQVARLFRAAAEAETLHAHSHLRAMQGVRSTAENLEEAVGGETYEFKEMYPPMIDAAKEEGNKQAERSFTFANEAEKVHAAMYQKYLENIGNLPDADIQLCTVCGYLTEGDAPDKCPICSAGAKAFKAVQ